MTVYRLYRLTLIALLLASSATIYANETWTFELKTTLIEGETTLAANPYVAVSPDGKKLALWDGETLEIRESLEKPGRRIEHSAPVARIVLANKRLLLVLDDVGKIHAYDAAKSRPIWTKLITESSPRISWISIAPNEKTVAVASSRRCCLLDAASGEFVGEPFDDAASMLHFCDKGKVLLMARYKEYRFYPLEGAPNWERYRTTKTGGIQPTSVTPTPTGAFILSKEGIFEIRNKYKKPKNIYDQENNFSHIAAFEDGAVVQRHTKTGMEYTRLVRESKKLVAEATVLRSSGRREGLAACDLSGTQVYVTSLGSKTNLGFASRLDLGSTKASVNLHHRVEIATGYEFAGKTGMTIWNPRKDVPPKNRPFARVDNRTVSFNRHALLRVSTGAVTIFDRRTQKSLARPWDRNVELAAIAGTTTFFAEPGRTKTRIHHILNEIEVPEITKATKFWGQDDGVFFLLTESASGATLVCRSPSGETKWEQEGSSADRFAVEKNRVVADGRLLDAGTGDVIATVEPGLPTFATEGDRLWIATPEDVKLYSATSGELRATVTTPQVKNVRVLDSHSNGEILIIRGDATSTPEHPRAGDSRLHALERTK